jgi:hypothetical protein
MKIVKCIWAVSLGLLLFTCATSPKAPELEQANSPATKLTEAEVLAEELSLPSWTSQHLIEEGGKSYLIVTGPTSEAWSALLKAAASKLGQAQQASALSLSKPVAPDIERKGQGWWKVEFPSAPVVVPTVPIDPSLKTEKEAADQLVAGLVITSVDSYLQASLETLRFAPGNKLRFTELFGKAFAVLGNVNLKALPATYTTVTGQPFAQPFQVRVVYAVDGKETPLGSAPLRFSSKLKKNGRMTLTGQTLLTGVDGVAAFAFPPPDFSGQDEVVVVLDVNSWLEKLVALPSELQDQVRRLENLSAQKKVSMPYRIDSLSKGIPMSIAFADFDEKGGLLRKGDSLNSLVSNFSKSGFEASANNNINLALLKKDDSTVLLAWLSQGKRTGRAIFGTSTVTEVLLADKKYTVTVNGSLKVYDLGTRKLVYQQKGGKAATASDRTTAISQALQLMAADFVNVLIDALP